MSQTKAIIFDCFGVLVASSLAPFCEHYLGASKELIEEASYLDRQASMGQISYDEFVSRMAALAKISEKETLAFLDNNPRNKKLLNYIEQELKAEYKIGFLSNASDNWLDELFTPEQVRMFDQIVLSYDVKLAKPDHKIYEITADKLGVAASECIFVDDVERYCTAAEEVGMKAIHYQNFPMFKKELLAIIDK